MEFDVFLKLVSKLGSVALPQNRAHDKMTPLHRKSLKINNDILNKARQAAVLALFYPDDNYQTKFVLILRNTYKGQHSAQVSFPGGKPEKEDGTLKNTAIRETFEEIGVPAQSVKILKRLSPVYIPTSNFNVQPYLAMLHDKPLFKKDPREVHKIIEVNLSYFLESQRVVNHKVLLANNTDVEVPAFNLHGHMVWGATAMMLSEIKDLLKPML